MKQFFHCFPIFVRAYVKVGVMDSANTKRLKEKMASIILELSYEFTCKVNFFVYKYSLPVASGSRKEK